MLCANEEMKVFMYGRVGVPWAHKVPRGDSTQDALRHNSNDGWFDEGLRERLGCSTKWKNRIRHEEGAPRQVNLTWLSLTLTQTTG
jgi:hypothetical protein